MKKLRFPVLTLSAILLLSSAISIQAEEIKEHVLKNGLRVLTLEDHSSPIVAFNIWYSVGSRNEKTGTTGISHLLEHMMFKGSDKFPEGAHSRLITQNGGYDNAMTSTDFTGYHCVLPSDKLELAMQLESDRMTGLNVYDEELQSEREVVIEERRYRTDNSIFGTVLEQLWAVAFQAHSYHSQVIGWMSDIRQITRDNLYNHYKTYYAPNNGTIIIAGDFDTDDTLKMVKKYFEKLKPQELPQPYECVEPEQKGERRVRHHMITQMPVVVTGYKIPGKGHEDYYPLSVISYILSTGESSRIYRKLVYEDRSALFAGGWADARRDYGLFLTYAAIQPGHALETVENSLNEELEKLKTEFVTDRELEKAKNQLEAQSIFSLESNEDKSVAIGTAEFLQLDYKLYTEAPGKIREVTKERIMEVAKKYFGKDQRNVVMLLPEEMENTSGNTENNIEE